MCVQFATGEELSSSAYAGDGDRHRPPGLSQQQSVFCKIPSSMEFQHVEKTWRASEQDEQGPPSAHISLDA